MLQKIETDQAPKAIGPYSQGIATEQFVFVSGQIPIDPKSGKLVDPTIEGQTRQVFDHIEAILKAAGLTLAHVVKTEIYVKDLNDFQAVNQLYMDSLIEISCIAVK